MSAAKKILFLLNDAPFFVSHRLALAVAARHAGMEVHVAVPFEARAVATIRAAGIEHHDYPLRRGSRGPLGELRLIFAMARLLRRIKPDLLHCVTMKPVLYGGLLARLMGLPAVVHAITGLGYLFLIEGAAARLQRRFVLALYRFALGHGNSRAIFQNPDDLELFRQHGLVEPARVVMIRGCGVDMALFQPAPGEPGLVIFPARIIGDKGAREFVEAAGLLKQRGRAARCVLVGRTDPDNPTYISEAEIKGWQDQGIVEWWGFEDDMPGLLGRAEIVCLPSYREGLPRVLIEAAAAGKPIVTSDVPGCREVVTEGDNGFLAPARDGAAVAEALERLLADAKLRQRLGERSRERAVAEFSVEEFIAASLTTYRAVLPSGTIGP
ncbi:MAG TPA: glycosyltransferase family 4 protein [Alphaproteobacteria bacterium]|jgi:glycosyltransferase involved in cell wall biosynthesis|nr:glycosyltransferase family 4 protein [Alphaproteobacteria bacterium]